MRNDLADALPKSWLVFPLAMILLAPGWLLLDLTGLRKRFDLGEQVALSVGLSLAIIPILLLWSTALGLTWNWLIVTIGGSIISAAALIRLISIIRNQRSTITNLQPTFALLAIFIFSLVVRLAMIRDLSAPPWVDSVHHAVIARLIVEKGAFPKTYSPYINIEANQYHAGFHSILAVFHWLSGLELPETMLLLGQVLNALAVFASYLFTTTLIRSRRAGVVAALVTGLLTPMPAYLTSWGRYTQLAGMLILPAVFAFAREVHNRVPRAHAIVNKGLYYGLTGIAAAGLFLVHYRVAAFVACLLLAYYLCQVRGDGRENRLLLRNAVGLGLVSGLVAFLFSLPWAWPTFTRVFAPIIARGSGETAALFSDFSWRFLNAGMGQLTLNVAYFGLAWGFLGRKRFALATVLWLMLMFSIANLGALGLPGGGFVNNTSVEITLFLPISALAGYLVGQIYILVKRIPLRVMRKPLRLGLTVGLIVLAIIGARKLLPILNPVTMLFRTPDRPAMEWIAKNIPAEETILINPFLWGYGIYAGNDGGFWITPLTGRKTLPPPVLYGMGSADERRQITDACLEIVNRGNQADVLWEIMQSHGIRFVYAGARGGVISPTTLQASSRFITRYANNGVWIFETR
jgi:hypothetical protein